MGQKTKGVLNAETEAKKTFTYNLDGVQFSFTMRVDIKKDLKAGVQIFKRAIEDFEKELEKIN